MKKVFLVTVAAVIASAGFSQVRFGGQVIGNLNNVSINNEDIPDVNKSLKAGFGAGVVVDIPVAERISLRPSLNYLQKNAKVSFVTFGKTNTVTSNLSYIELPINVVYTLPVGKMSAYFGAGPSLGYGAGGKVKFKGWDFIEGDLAEDVEYKFDAFKKEEDGGAGLRRFEVSGNAIAGLQFSNGLYVNAGYLLGLNNLAEEDGKYKNQSITLTVGFLLGSKKG